MCSKRQKPEPLTRSRRSSTARRYCIEVNLLLSSLCIARMIDERRSPFVRAVARLGVVQALPALSSVSSRELLELDPMGFALFDKVCTSMGIVQDGLKCPLNVRILRFCKKKII